MPPPPPAHHRTPRHSHASPLLAPADKPELEVVFFNESIDAKQMRSAKTQLKAQLFAKQATPLLSTGTMHPLGYRGAERRRPAATAAAASHHSLPASPHPLPPQASSSPRRRAPCTTRR